MSCFLVVSESDGFSPWMQFATWMYRSLILDINSPVVFIITAREFSCLAWLNYSTILQKLISFTCTPVSVKKTNTYCFVSLLLMAGWGKEEKAGEVEKSGGWRISQLDAQSKHIAAVLAQIKVETCMSQSQSASLQQHMLLWSQSLSPCLRDSPIPNCQLPSSSFEKNHIIKTQKSVKTEKKG